MSGSYYGDFPASHTAVCMVFDSFAASTGASSATSNFAAADIQIYKDGGTTQRASASGIVVSTSFDGSTGLQMVTIDLSDNTDAGFYATGHEYLVAVADVTIDSQTVRFWLGSFSIERAGGILALLKATGSVKVDVAKWNTTTVATPNTAGVPLVDTARWAGTLTTLTGGLPDVNTKTITAGIIAAATFAANALDAVWTTATRLLTAGTNIVLAKGTGVTGFNDVAAGAAMTLTAAYDFAKGTVAVTESYAADGAAPTPIQSLMLIQQQLGEMAISGTTMTVKKVDGATSAATFTLNSATSPTSITRAT